MVSHKQRRCVVSRPKNTDEICLLTGGVIMLPYYVLEKTEECRLFFYSHKGFFNFWNQYLILNLGYKVFDVMVNRPHTKFNGSVTIEQKQHFQEVKKEHFEAHLPEKMFADFPELEIMRTVYFSRIKKLKSYGMR